VRDIPSVSVIICAYTEERLVDIKEAVDSVLKQTLPPDEVILSIDHNPELAEILKNELPNVVKIVRNDGVRGLSETRNVGIRNSSSDIIAFIDDDAVADRDWLKYLVNPFKDVNVAAVGGKAVPLWLSGSRPSWFPEELDWIVGCTYKGLPIKNGRIRNVIGCNMAFRSSVFQQIGGFRSEVGRMGKTSGVGEEAELCLRITGRMQGQVILFESKSLINHKVPSWRLKFSYICKRAGDEGFYKTKVQRLTYDITQSSYSTENLYLKYLWTNSIPRRLIFFHRHKNINQIGIIIISIMSVGYGYIMGKVMN
jgi:cellulose synthase/poly-beta-1,6-N-acetylglucosamine synthase-like glycosyltransferase